MKIAHFRGMFISIPISDGETVDDVEDRLIDAIDSVGDGVVMSYKLTVEDEEQESR